MTRKPFPSTNDGDEVEIARRRDELAKRMLNTPPRPLKPKGADGLLKSPRSGKTPGTKPDE